MRYVGIDPGVTGAIAHIWDGAPSVTDLMKMDVGKDGTTRNVLDTRSTWERLRDLACVDAPHDALFLLEAPIYGPAAKKKEKDEESVGHGIVSLCNGFRLNGQIEGMLVALAYIYGCRYEIINPQVWKRAMMPGEARDKDAARLKAIQLFPSVAEQLKLKKHHNRAEALLLAEWGRRRG